MRATYISTADLAPHLQDLDWVVIDCRFVLVDKERGRRDYHKGHIPQALYAHLEEDLSAPVVPQKTGRHPLPDPNDFSRICSYWGIDGKVQVVVYDDAIGAFAARLWWMLRWLGHHQVAVLDGGWQQWQKENRPVSDDVPSRTPRSFLPRLRSCMHLNANQVQKLLEDPNYRLLDARGADRYRGENETIDPVAGHIPHALSAPYMKNTGPDGRVLLPAALQKRFLAMLGHVKPEQTVCYCGSGVTACHNLLAMAHAGLGDGKLYAGSWSDWITDPKRPIAC